MAKSAMSTSPVTTTRRCTPIYFGAPKQPIGPLILTILCKQASRGYAFVRFINKQDAEDALEKLQDYVMEGRELRIAFAQKR
jgi:hypothetical protein